MEIKFSFPLFEQKKFYPIYIQSNIASIDKCKVIFTQKKSNKILLAWNEFLYFLQEFPNLLKSRNIGNM